MKKFILTISLIIITLSFYNCEGERPVETTRDTGVEYAPQMYHTIPWDPFRQKEGDKIMAPFDPPAHTVARGKLDYYYPYPNTPEGYEQAGQELKMQLPYTKENIAEGKRLFQHFCAHCHGPEGDANGSLVEAGKFPPPPLKFKQKKDLPVGKMYHTIMYGKGLMGSHAGQLSPKQRWQIIQYIQILQKGTADVEEGLKLLTSSASNQDSLKTEN